MRIAVASDFHLNALTDQQFMPRFVEAINQQHPDLVLLLGDVVEGDWQDADLAPYAAQFRNVRSRPAYMRYWEIMKCTAWRIISTFSKRPMWKSWPMPAGGSMISYTSSAGMTDGPPIEKH